MKLGMNILIMAKIRWNFSKKKSLRIDEKSDTQITEFLN